MKQGRVRTLGTQRRIRNGWIKSLGTEMAHHARESQKTPKKVYEAQWYLSEGEESPSCCNEGLGKRGKRKPRDGKKAGGREEHGLGRPRVLASPHHFVIGVERLRGPGRYDVEGAMGSRGLRPYTEQGGGTRKAPEAAERGAPSQGGRLRPERQAAQRGP